ncbi:type VI secretion system membrane subunit TssM [Xenorhabdus littoralis]|uniref:type VI secretion system membrane subunit TssM n=1 Tax=Xenorhabdus littoralis TaxID=2582835 RepID=UPI0029E8227F|nr:type VI secretion system membrane subunit TssM [Xenorhabdus sp. psl]MDX7990442.1 type VI secretion system membrane subunit TssM [Xenorhabdus sp. psl]
MLNIILSIITNRLMWSFLGITAISFIIWFIGPIISIGSAVPFESNTVRVITIISLFLIWLLIQSVPPLYRTWLNKKLSSQLNKDKDNKQGEQSHAIQDGTLSERFSDVARLLKNANFYGLNPKYKSGWRHLSNRQYLYQLPWYVVIGAPHSGKTSVLANSGLHFPLADHFENSVLYSQQETGNCNWWFTNDAVFLDTAGRYITQDTQNTLDASEWTSFIKLLKKYRTRQPVNGVIVTVSVEDLFNPLKEARQRQAYMLHRRLSELHDHFKIRLPIYVIITKTDLLKGFSAYFTHLDKAQRDQIWGFNFPWNEANWNMKQIFEQQYSLLQQRLDAELPDILLRQHDLRNCADSYLFPQEFAALGPKIEQYLEVTFAKSGFEIPYSPRGLYFTSGIQEGVSFDSVMEKINHALQLPTDSDNNSDNSSLSRGNNKNAFHQHQAYFLKNLLGSIIQEAGLADYNRWWVYRNRLLNGLGYIILMAIMGAIVALLFASYNNNKNYLMEVQAKTPLILRQFSELKKSTDSADIYPLLPILNDLESLGKSRHFSLDNPPLSYQMGLYCGEQVSDASWSLYTKALQTLLLPQVAQLITSQLHQDRGADMEGMDGIDGIYRTLKAYQMLYQPKHYNGKFLRNWVMQYLYTHSQSSIPHLQLRQINEHLSQLLDNQVVTSPYVREDQRVEKKQILLSSIPPAQYIYIHLKNNLLSNANLSTVSLATLAGPKAELVFSRISGASITQGIPGMFTPTGYQTAMDKELNSLIDTLYNQDSWVLGSYARQQSAGEIALYVRQLYINDYIYQWDKFLSDIRLNNIDSLDQHANMARLLSSSFSPIRNLLVNISKNITLDTSLKNNQADKISNIVTGKTRSLEKSKAGSLTQLVPKQMLPDNKQPEPEQILKEHFAQLTELANSSDEEKGKIPFDSTIQQIGELYRYLISVQNAADTGMPAPADKAITQLQATAKYLPMPFKHIIYSLVTGASNDTQLSDMKNLEKHLKTEVSNFCHRAIANRYPLTQGARNDIKPDDMARMFTPKTGIMDIFFQKYLAGKVDTTQADWHMIAGTGIAGIDRKMRAGDKKLLRPFKQAQIIRDTLFNSGMPVPSFRVIVRAVNMDNNILSMILDIDGQQLQYSHGPQIPHLINWPGTGKTNQIHIQLNLDDGTTSNLTISGPWALNRLLDMNSADISSGDISSGDTNRAKRRQNPNSDDNTKLLARFNINGHFVTLEFIPNSIFSPFQLPNFTCPVLINS